MIVAICGSIRESLDDMRELERRLTIEGHVVLFPVPITAEDHNPYLDALHLYRITLADSVAAVTKPNGFFGVSTSREVEFATLLDKTPVVYTHRELTDGVFVS